ncbi:MAG: 2-amino-4-hydroxy-6-hydroxymethyldihydropteridine diphosphokinase [Dehalococcoidia bacterium]|nr:2-amino-4-hydroxy-6-hydroxymethyldihydropteridine diphosphokinase [Dehalococcoidia bacterium]
MGRLNVYLGLGSNLGDRLSNITNGISALSSQSEIEFKECSSIYETEPWGYSNQPYFLNCAIRIRTSMKPIDLLSLVKSIESMLGREPSFRNGPRSLDIDILFYGDQVISSSMPDLQIPHPRIIERSFVCLPLSEIAPTLVHPVSGIKIRDISTSKIFETATKKWSAPINSQHLPSVVHETN